jgi:hypothetical protein
MKRIVLWTTGWVVIGALMLAAGCGQRRWCPTDPRMVQADTSRMVIVDSWTIDVGTTVNAIALWP